MTLNFYPIPFIRRDSITKLRFKFIYTLPIYFFLSFNVFGRVHNRPSKIIFCRRVLVCDSGPESESVKFYRLQLQLRLQPKRSTPTDSNSGLDSDSAALTITDPANICFYLPMLTHTTQLLINGTTAELTGSMTNKMSSAGARRRGGWMVSTRALFITGWVDPQKFRLFLFKKISRNCFVGMFTTSSGRKPRRNKFLRVGRF